MRSRKDEVVTPQQAGLENARYEGWWGRQMDWNSTAEPHWNKLRVIWLLIIYVFTLNSSCEKIVFPRCWSARDQQSDQGHTKITLLLPWDKTALCCSWVWFNEKEIPASRNSPWNRHVWYTNSVFQFFLVQLSEKQIVSQFWQDPKYTFEHRIQPRASLWTLWIKERLTNICYNSLLVSATLGILSQVNHKLCMCSLPVYNPPAQLQQ